ncbi:MAG TPA: DUF5709 domain-containing protein [Mycobacteriales bacterium]|nr:DUF5709 domain-containing protein [Mycobacteriales bacterium]
MTSRIPEPPSAFEAEGIPEPGTLAENEDETGQLDGAMSVPRDVPTAVEDFGTTAAEVHDGEPLDGRLAREEPDVLDAADRPADESATADTPFAQAAGQGIGRLVEPDEGARTDSEKDMVASDVGTDLGGYSAEESAMHLEPEA